jgi:hypothetical protein
MSQITELRSACAEIAARARHVRVNEETIARYASPLPLEAQAAGPDPAVHLIAGSREQLAAFWLTLDAINFGSGWFPTLRKRTGQSGYFTIARGIRERFVSDGPWSARELATIDAAEIAAALGQDPAHELMELFARSLSDLGIHIAREFDNEFAAVVDAAGPEALALVERLAGWDCFADCSVYDGLRVPFLKRAQIAAADLASAGVARFQDLDRLTMFADNLVPHVLRLDGVLGFEPRLVERIERRELLEHGSAEEVEIRACAVQAVELIVRARSGGTPTTAAQVDQLLWNRGQGARYKSQPRHRCRCTAY